MKKILIVEDNQILAENFARIFRNDFEVFQADSASDAISKIDQKMPDLIFLDILLNGHSAFSLLNELQSYADTAKIPVMICSNLAEDLDLRALRNYGVKCVLDKAETDPREILKKAKEACATD